jgi:hypothetical protein
VDRHEVTFFEGLRNAVDGMALAWWSEIHPGVLPSSGRGGST